MLYSNCAVCGKEFYVSPSRRANGKGKYCSLKCRYESQKNKPLKDERRAKISAAKKGKLMGEKNPMWNRHHTLEAKTTIGAANKGKLSGENSPMKHPEVAAKVRAALIGRSRSPEIKAKIRANSPMKRPDLVAKMRATHIERGVSVGERNPMFGKPPAHGKGGWYTYNGRKIWLRSSYEVRVAECLTKLNIPWVYEPHAFPITLTNGTKATYRPDFLLNEKEWIEVKGWLRPRDKEKIQAFLREYPNLIYYLWGIEDIKTLESLT